MKIRYFRALCIALLLCKTASCVPLDTLYIDSEIREIQANRYFKYFNSAEELPLDSVWKVFQKKQVEIQPLDKVNFGPVNGYYWLTLTIKNNSKTKQDLYLDIRQVHLYRIAFHQVRNDSVIRLSETGIKYDFYHRPAPYRFFDFPLSLQSNESFTVLLMVHHINSMTLPLYVVSEQFLHEMYYRQNLLWGIWVGSLIFCALFALMGSIFLRRSIFLWYFFYIFSAALYGFTDLGYGFQFLFPGRADLDAPAIIHLSVYAVVFLIKFSQGLLETRKYLPLVHKILNGIFYFLLLAIAAGYIMPEVMFRYSTFVLPVLNVVILTGLVLMAFSGIRAFLNNRVIAILYLTAYLILILASVFVVLNFGFGLYQYAGPNPIMYSYFIEAVLLSVALVIFFRQMQKERSELMIKVAEQQKQMYQEYITGIEKERSRIAGELHDDVGSRLSYLKKLLLTHSTESIKTADQVDQLIKDVRQLSHDLAPPLSHITGLIPLIEKLIADTRHVTGLDVKLQVYDYKDVLTPPQIQQIYRIIQEAFQNINKHAQATRVDIQIFGHPEEIDIIIEDNGIGFEKGNETGLGLSQMKIRTESLGGRIEINSHPGAGTHILVQVPISV